VSRQISSGQLVLCLLLTVTFVVISGSDGVEDAAGGREVRSSVEPLIGHRFPPSAQKGIAGDHGDDGCRAGGLCVGPGRLYPIGRQPGVLMYSIFTVPELPQQFDRIETTYYDYFNIFWPGEQPTGGYMNQFVPQLMLGNVLANSSNYPDYDPYWIAMDTWHIGAQYFMGLCATNATAPDGFICDGDHWIPKAATGKLIPVEPDEVIETSFELVEVRDTGWEWQLQMGVVGQPHRLSLVVADCPFMGLINATKSWQEDRYENIDVGSCLENYGMTKSKNYSPKWEIAMEVWPPPGSLPTFSYWPNWNLSEIPCPWQPTSSVSTASTNESQWAVWKAILNSSRHSNDPQITSSLRAKVSL
jgi:hypothetical protein